MKVYLVGAGPGDIELMTLKSVRILREADVILYDALIDKKVLDFCKENTQKIFVGKRKNSHLLDQNEINELLLKYAKEYKTVVRLKGGTPFVFGRGHEELSFLNSHGISVEIVSGVSSSTAVPESFKIPLIDRSYSDSYRTITGHKMDIFKEIVTSFHPRENLVIMMGAHNLKDIVSHLLGVGFLPKTPIALLSKGCSQDALKISATLEEISQKDSGFFDYVRSLTPLIIYIGETLNAADSIN